MSSRVCPSYNRSDTEIALSSHSEQNARLSLPSVIGHAFLTVLFEYVTGHLVARTVNTNQPPPPAVNYRSTMSIEVTASHIESFESSVGASQQ